MKVVNFFIDNMKIGGFQRLCLDQAYCFSDLGYTARIYVLTDVCDSEDSSFVKIESDMIAQKQIGIKSLQGRTITQLRLIKSITNTSKSDELFICHSLRATVLIYISQIYRFTKFNSVTTIHQLPTLSAPVQRLKRFVYSQFSKFLFAYSEAVKLDWDFRLSRFGLLKRVFFRKRIKVLRNGIYLHRIPQMLSNSSHTRPRLIFLGRTTSWKGLDNYLNYSRMPDLKSFDLLLMIPSIDSAQKASLVAEFGDRLEFMIGESIASFRPRAGDVHFYAVNYGVEAKYIEGVSLNCLEMAACGVPTVISSDGLGTWPDLAQVGIFLECNWENEMSTVATILRASKTKFSQQEKALMRKTVSVENNVHFIENLVKSPTD